MDTRMGGKTAAGYAQGRLIIEGKTKKVYEVEGQPDLAILLSKDDITAGDGARHDVIADKSRLANQTACNVFRLLKDCGLPVAFEAQNSPVSFVAPACAMLPYEVVIRREAHGSYLKRNPHLAKGHLFPRLLVEFFLKTSGKRWKAHTLPCDDPLMALAPEKGEIRLYNPAQPLYAQEPFLVLKESDVFSQKQEHGLLADMDRLARKAFLVLEKAWQLEGRTLVDFKVEFGVTKAGQLLLADVIDNDSWRVLENGAYIDKQVYRDGGALTDVADKYRHVAEMTGRFRLPHQQIVIWRGSDKDKIDSVLEALGDSGRALVTDVTCSVHKEPVLAVTRLDRAVQSVPDTVVIAYIGRSNGAGPTLSAVTGVPVITVPASFKDFPEDVWSSLRAPSNVPVMTVIEPANAALAALRILSARNPLLYAEIRADLEKRLVNMVPV